MKFINRFLFAASMLASASLACGLFSSSSALTSGEQVLPVITVAPPIAQDAEGEPTVSHANEPADSPMDEPTATPENEPGQAGEAQVSLQKELFFGGGGAGSSGCTLNPVPAQSPAIVDLGRYETAPDETNVYPSYLSGLLCLYGFKEGETISVDVTSPEGQAFSTTIGSDKLFQRSEDGMQVVPLYMNWPVGLPLGRWQIYAYSRSVDALGTFEIPPILFPALTLVESGAYNPFFEKHDEANITRSDTLKVIGAGFQPAQTVPLGIYHENPQKGAWDLVAEGGIDADSDGFIGLEWTFDPDDLPGRYCLIAVVFPDTTIDLIAGPRVCAVLE